MSRLHIEVVMANRYTLTLRRAYIENSVVWRGDLELALACRLLLIVEWVIVW